MDDNTPIFLQESDNLLYQKMYQYMEDHPEYQTATNDEGLERYLNLCSKLLIGNISDTKKFKALW